MPVQRVGGVGGGGAWACVLCRADSVAGLWLDGHRLTLTQRRVAQSCSVTQWRPRTRVSDDARSPSPTATPRWPAIYSEASCTKNNYLFFT